MKPKAESMCETKQRVIQDAASRPVIVLLHARIARLNRKGADQQATIQRSSAAVIVFCFVLRQLKEGRQLVSSWLFLFRVF